MPVRLNEPRRGQAAAPPPAPPAREPPSSPGPWADAYPGLALLLDGQGAIVYANQGLSGLDPPEMVGVDVLNFVPEADRALVRATLQDAVHPGLPHTIELPLLDAGGKSRTWHLAAVVPMPLPSGRPGILVTGLDITQRREEEKRLRHAEQLFVDTEGLTHIGTWYWDVKQAHAQWSEEMYHIYGLDAASHVPTYQDYLTRIHPDDVERVKSATEAVFKDRKPYAHDERIRHTDGSWRWLHTWARAIEDEQGNLVALAGVCQDITDRKRSEIEMQRHQARFRVLFERSMLGVAILDGEGRILEANAALRSLRGQPDDDVGGRPLESLFVEEHSASCRVALAELAPGSSPGRQLDLAIARKGQATQEVRLTLAHVQGTEDSNPFIVALFEDRSLAERALASDRLAYARLQDLRQAEEASERRRQLLHIASHELKNPLTPVRMQLHMLEKSLLGPLNPRQEKAVAVASKQVRRITQLLQDVLDVARIEQGQLSIKPERMDAAAAVSRVLEAFSDVAKEWHIHLEGQATAGLWVEADPERLEQVLFNLVSNALKFTPAGGHVRMEAALRDRDVELSVVDTGPGMDASQQARLFKAFSQVHAPGAARQEGTGLGLYIARSITVAMKGTLQVESKPGHGSRFTVRLPAVPVPPATP
jgi:PAS domain S-box-containing protein